MGAGRPALYANRSNCLAIFPKFVNTRSHSLHVPRRDASAAIHVALVRTNARNAFVGVHRSDCDMRLRDDDPYPLPYQGKQCSREFTLVLPREDLFVVPSKPVVIMASPHTADRRIRHHSAQPELKYFGSPAARRVPLLEHRQRWGSHIIRHLARRRETAAPILMRK